MFKSVSNRVSHRRGSLLCIAALFGIGGEQLVTAPPVVYLPGYELILKIAPFHIWGVIWCAVAAVCVVSLRFERIVPFAFVGVELLLMAWGGSLGYGHVVHHTYRGLFSATTYFVLAALFLIISSWQEAPSGQ